MATKAASDAPYQLDEAAQAAWDRWHEQQNKASEASKRAGQAKDGYITAHGDRAKCVLPDGRIIERRKKPRKGYKVLDGVTIVFEQVLE